MYRVIAVLLLAVGGAATMAGAETPAAPELIGEFDLTYYWVSSHKDFSGPADTTLYDKTCKPLAVVPRSFATRIALEGTARLKDGRVLNVAGPCKCGFSPCVFELSKRKRWGVGVNNRKLSPFRSVAVDSTVIPIGTRLYIPELDGLRMPGRPPWGGYVHDGCVVADDRGGSIRGNEIDFFSGRRAYYRILQRKHRFESVTAYDGSERCKHLGAGARPRS